MTPRWHAYAPRTVRFLGVRPHAGWRLKTYSISYDGAFAEGAFEGGVALARAALPAPAVAETRAGAGFVILHHGRGMDYLVLGWWDRENELPLRVFVKEQDRNAAWRAAQGAESVCVWDLDIVWQERQAWVQTVLAEGRPETVDAYLARSAVGVEDAAGAARVTARVKDAADLERFDDRWDFDDPAATERQFRDLLPQAEAAGRADLALQLRTQIARTLGLQRRFDDAHALLDSVETELGGADAVARVRFLLERGRVLNSSGKPKDARPLFEEAWNRGRESGIDGFAVDAAHMVAIVAAPDEALQWNETALDLARRSEDPRARKWRGSLLNNLGWTRHDRGEFAEALRLFEDALAVRREEGTSRQVEIARWCVARCLRSLGRLDEALAAQESLRQDMAAAEHEQDGYVSEELGECLLARGQAEAARPHFADAYRLLSPDPWLAEREPQRIERLRELGVVALEAK